MPRIGPHYHPCSRCQARTECCGDIEQNYDGSPEFICLEYHTLANREFTPVDHFLCEKCDGAMADILGIEAP